MEDDPIQALPVLMNLVAAFLAFSAMVSIPDSISEAVHAWKRPIKERPHRAALYALKAGVLASSYAVAILLWDWAWTWENSLSIASALVVIMFIVETIFDKAEKSFIRD